MRFLKTAALAAALAAGTLGLASAPASATPIAAGSFAAVAGAVDDGLLTQVQQGFTPRYRYRPATAGPTTPGPTTARASCAASATRLMDRVRSASAASHSPHRLAAVHGARFLREAGVLMKDEGRRDAQGSTAPFLGTDEDAGCRAVGARMHEAQGEAAEATGERAQHLVEAVGAVDEQQPALRPEHPRAGNKPQG